MTTLREAAQMALEALDSKHDMTKAEWRVLQYHAFTALRAALAAPPEELDLPKVQLWEFLKLIEGKEDFRGIPMMRTEWPTQGEALAQPEQEPVAYDINGATVYIKPPVYGAAPPQREWQSLTDEEIEKLFVWQEWSEDFADYEPVARSIERILREKNT